MSTEETYRKLQIMALQKTVIVLGALAKQLEKTDRTASEETKCLGRAVMWAIEELSSGSNIR